MKKIKSLKHSTINKLIAGLCLIGILSVVNCDNESDKETPALQKVSLSARQIDDGVKAVIQTGKAYVKLTITTDQAGSTYAKYYKTNQDKSPTELKGLKFTIQKDGSIDAFFLKASHSGITYWVQQFDLYDKDPDATDDKGTLQYSLSEKKDFTLKTEDSENNVTIDLIKKISGDEGDSTTLKSPSFSVQTANKHPFIVSFLNASQQFFKKSNDYAISFTVKHGEDLSKARAVTDANADYNNTNIFKNAKDGDNFMKIFLPRSKHYYEDKVFVVEATVKRTTSGSIEHTFDISGDVSADVKIKAGKLPLKINNKFPTIKITGGDRSNSYSETNKTFDLSTSVSAIKIFEPSDTDNDPFTNTYKWALYKEGVKVDNATIHSPTASDNIKITDLSSGSIRPEGIMIDNNITSLEHLPQSEVSKYTLKGYAKADDGLGGITEETVEFNFVLKRYVTIQDQNFLNYLKTKLSANAFNNEGKLDVISPEVYNLKDINVTGKGVNSLQGIEHFTNLTHLSCANNNKLTGLDLSQNKALTYIHCGGNQLTELDVTNNTALNYFDCANNNLTTLDLTNNTSLTYLECGSNQLQSLDVTNNTSLTYFHCNNNKLKDLDVTYNYLLKNLDVSNNQLTNLNLSHHTNLRELNVSNNQLQSLDVSKSCFLRPKHIHHDGLSWSKIRHCGG